jgi:undecaprenyl-diphosphatase
VTLVFAALLGIVQGLTEFLPISSSAHLILARAFFGWDAEAFGLPFDVACHVGTFVAVLAYFRVEVLAMLAAVPRLFDRSRESRLARLIVIGTVPVVIVGLLWADAIEAHARTPGVAAVTLALGAVALLAAERLGSRRRDEDSIGASEAFGLGVAQAAALVPGVSRSGATIAVGMLRGLRRDAAARFSFLLGLPAVLAAAAKEGLELAKAGVPADQIPLFAVGMIVSAVVGYLTIKYFLRYLVQHGLEVFAWYRLALAASVVLWIVAR